MVQLDFDVDANVDSVVWDDQYTLRDLGGQYAMMNEALEVVARDQGDVLVVVARLGDPPVAAPPTLLLNAVARRHHLASGQVAPSHVASGNAGLVGDKNPRRVQPRKLAGLARMVPIVTRPRGLPPPAPMPDDTGWDRLSHPALQRRAARDGPRQLGTLGRGNHFLELTAGEDGAVWILVHSGSANAGDSGEVRIETGSAVAGAAGKITVFEYIPTAIDARPFTVPDCERTVVFRPWP